MTPLELPDAAAWEAWLERHHDDGDGAWLQIAKKRAPVRLIAIEQALEGALCFGWIDSQRKGLDEHRFLQRYSRRRAGSPWSSENVARAEALIAAGRMRAPGFAEIAAARADGRWEAAYAAQRDATVPPELEVALAADPAAAARFAALDKTARYLLILPLLKARSESGRARRIARTVADLARERERP